MNTPTLVKGAGAAVALAFLSACAGSGSTQMAPPSATGATSHTSVFKNNTLFVDGRPITAARMRTAHHFEQIAPDMASKHYEYVFNDYTSYGSIFKYPKRNDQIGTVDGTGGQGCTNVLYGYGKKIFWNAGRINDQITEYQVPDTVIKSVSAPYDYTSSCAMNEAGDLAVGVLLGNGYSAGGQEIIFKNATGKGTVINTPLYKAYFAGYDPKGNLFADGEDQSYNFMLVEIPKGSTKAVQVTTSNTVEFPGSVQWDGKYITVFDQLTSQTFQYTIKGTTATLVNTITFNGAGDCAQTWLVKGLMYCGDYYNDNGSAFKYPEGGNAVAVFSGNFDGPLGVVAANK
jgi:hypothetical protein